MLEVGRSGEMKGIRISVLRACSYRSIAAAVSLSLAANAPLAALADGGAPARSFRVAQDSPQAAPSQHGPAAQPATAPSGQENLFWDSVTKSNTAADYKAYLDA